MPRNIAQRRGRKPSIGTAARQARELKKSLKTLTRDLDQLQERLVLLEKFYRARERFLMADRGRGAAASAGLRGRGPNVRDVAYEILTRSRRPMNITVLASRVIRRKGGEAGANFTQNLGAALHRDRRFRRAARGLYEVR